MLSKKHNDSFYWQNKLDALDSLPGEAAIEKNAMWEKLDSRLHKEKTGKKAIWYWIAAGLLPLIIVTLTMVHKKENTVAKQLTEKKTNTIVSVLPPASKETLTISIAAPVEKEKAVINTIEKEKIIKDTIQANVNTTVAYEKPEIITDTVSKNDTAFTMASATPVKKKLPVVHINELETFPLQFAAPVNYAENLSIKPRKNKTNNQNVATQQNRIGFNIKLSSKN